jgi:GrpB-like predicted nucleotidyltransferase (UPF0157 family)
VIVLAPYSSEWPLRFAQLRAELLTTFAATPVEVEHIGSTSVPGLSAKPVIDVLLGAGSLPSIESKTGDLERLGYRYVPKYERELPMRRYFVRAETATCNRVHLHGVVLGSQLWCNHLAFRDALRSDLALLASYQSLKRELATRFATDKSAYTAAKEPFIRSVLDALQPTALRSSESREGG